MNSKKLCCLSADCWTLLKTLQIFLDFSTLSQDTLHGAEKWKPKSFVFFSAFCWGIFKTLFISQLLEREIEIWDQQNQIFKTGKATKNRSPFQKRTISLTESFVSYWHLKNIKFFIMATQNEWLSWAEDRADLVRNCQKCFS